MEEKKISSAVIKRLPRYYRYLSELLEKGIDRISSHELSKKMNVTASQIRQDFNNFGGFIVLVMLVIFVALLSALMNAFTGMVTAYIYEAISGIKKEGNNENIDIEIK